MTILKAQLEVQDCWERRDLEGFKRARVQFYEAYAELSAIYKLKVSNESQSELSKQIERKKAAKLRKLEAIRKWKESRI
jgi:hypothetical protein